VEQKDGPGQTVLTTDEKFTAGEEESLTLTHTKDCRYDHISLTRSYYRMISMTSESVQICLFLDINSVLFKNPRIVNLFNLFGILIMICTVCALLKKLYV